SDVPRAKLPAPHGYNPRRKDAAARKFRLAPELPIGGCDLRIRREGVAGVQWDTSRPPPTPPTAPAPPGSPSAALRVPLFPSHRHRPLSTSGSDMADSIPAI